MKILEHYIHKETQKEYQVRQYDTGFEIWVNLVVAGSAATLHL